jgi:hypothetical protein
MVYQQQNIIHPIWGTPLGRDIYEKINFGQPLFDPQHTYATTDVDAGPSG